MCSLEPWDEVWRRNQFLVRELLALGSAPADPVRRAALRSRPSSCVGKPTARRAGVGSDRCAATGAWWPSSPASGCPACSGRSPTVRCGARCGERRARPGYVRPTLWINDPSFAGLVDDDRLALGVRHHRRLARSIAPATRPPPGRGERAHAASGRPTRSWSAHRAIAESRRTARDDCVLIPNAVDVAHFTTPRPRPIDLPRGRVAVYVGTLHEDRLDIELVAALASGDPRRPDRARRGPNALGPESRARLREMPAVHVLGSRAYADVPGYLQHADVVIVPHVVTPFTESLDPIKAYECAAVGRPTVAVAVAGFRGLDGAIRAVPREQFVTEVQAALEDGADAHPSTVPDWSDRGPEFAAVLARARATHDARRPLACCSSTIARSCRAVSSRLAPAHHRADAHDRGPRRAR